MKKKSIFLSIFAFILCVSVLTGINAPKKNPIFSIEKSSKAEEIIEYTIEEDENENLIDNDAENDCETCICVIGKAKLTLTPDMATITACIEKFNENIKLSQNENLEIFNKTIAALKDAGVSEDKITLDYFTSHPSYDYSEGRTPVGFYSKSCFSFEIENLENITNYISILTDNGVTNICSVCYSVSNMDEQYTNALSSALENAKTKAASLLGSDNYQICGIREENVYSASSLCKNYVENLSSSVMGKVEIEARVNVIFKKV